MKPLSAAFFLIGLVFYTSVCGQGIFNILPDQTSLPAFGTTTLTSETGASASNAGRALKIIERPSIPSAALGATQFEADQTKLQQFDPYPNESDVAFNTRMKVIYERSKVDMASAASTHIQLLKELSPGQFYGNLAAGPERH